MGVTKLAFAWVCAAGVIANAAQTPLPAVQIPTDTPDGREYRIHLPPAAAKEDCFVRIHQTGPFGGYGYGGYDAKKLSDGYTFRTGLKGKPASTLKVAMWCRGFGMAVVDEPSLGTSSFDKTLSLTPLKDIQMNGRLLTSADGVTLAGSTVRVWYVAHWLCEFFSLMDCGVPQWEVATATVALDQFELRVPDFAADPVVKKYTGWPHPGSFTFRADRAIAPYNYWLDTEQAKFGGIPVAATYPPLIFRPRRHGS